MIGIGISGSIAAYKICDLVSRLRKDGHSIRVIMTKAATNIVSPLCFQALTGYPTFVDGVSLVDDGMDHLFFKRECRVFLIAPATANTIAKLAYGIADNLLTTTVLSLRCPILFAPAMNPEMYDSKIVQHNIRRLKRMGFIEISPDVGKTACQDEGRGRLKNIDDLYREIQRYL